MVYLQRDDSSVGFSLIMVIYIYYKLALKDSYYFRYRLLLIIANTPIKKT